MPFCTHPKRCSCAGATAQSLMLAPCLLLLNHSVPLRADQLSLVTLHLQSGNLGRRQTGFVSWLGCFFRGFPAAQTTAPLSLKYFTFLHNDFPFFCSAVFYPAKDPEPGTSMTIYWEQFCKQELMSQDHVVHHLPRLQHHIHSSTAAAKCLVSKYDVPESWRIEV